MSDVQVTVFGYVGSDVEFQPGNGTADRAVFRVGSTPRYYDRGQGTWRDQETVWITVKAWRTLAHNVSSSVHKGEPVVVIGKLKTQVWDDKEAGERHSRDVLEATTVCHDLTKGTSAFLRSPRSAERAESDSADKELMDRLETNSETEPATSSFGQRLGAA